MILFDKRKALDMILGPNGEEIKKEDLSPFKTAFQEMMDAMKSGDTDGAMGAFKAALASVNSDQGTPERG